MENRNVFPNIKAVRNWSPTKDNHTFFHFWSKVLGQIGGGGGGEGRRELLFFTFVSRHIQIYTNYLKHDYSILKYLIENPILNNLL